MPGKIKVKILAGRNLPVMDRSGDTTDAYVEIKFGNTTYKTDVCRKSLNPQWNSEWYKFEVEDAELQDEPLQIRLMDHDTYSANDAIGKVYVNLNPLLLPGVPPPVKNIWTLEASMNSGSGSQGGSVMTGWLPVYDTMHGIRGEVNIVVKVELFLDFNKFRQSSCGVTFFYSPIVPHGYHAQVIHGFVEELIVSDDPEYKWIDKIRTPRASNEARQTLFLKLSNEVQRKIGLKALDLGGNAVIGYLQNFDLEGESGIVARGIGTVVTLVKFHDLPTFLSEPTTVEELASYGLKPNKPSDCSDSESSPRLPSRHHHHRHHHHHHHHHHQQQQHHHHQQQQQQQQQQPQPPQQQQQHQPVPSNDSSPARSPPLLGPKFPVGEIVPVTPLKLVECQPASPLSRQPSVQSWTSSKRPGYLGSSLSLADDVFDEGSLKALLALEDMRGEPQASRLSRGLRNLRNLPQSVLARRAKSKADSLDDESSDIETLHSSSWSIGGSDSAKSGSLIDLSLRKKKLKHKRNGSEGMAAMLIRSVHSSGLPLDIVKEDRETLTPSPVNLLQELSHQQPQSPQQEQQQQQQEQLAPVAIVELEEKPTERSDKQETNDEPNNTSGNDNVLLVTYTKLKVASEKIPTMSSSESDTSSSAESDEPSESSTNYNILDDTLSLVEHSSPEVESRPVAQYSPPAPALPSFASQPQRKKEEEAKVSGVSSSSSSSARLHRLQRQLSLVQPSGSSEEEEEQQEKVVRARRIERTDTVIYKPSSSDSHHLQLPSVDPRELAPITHFPPADSDAQHRHSRMLELVRLIDTKLMLHQHQHHHRPGTKRAKQPGRHASNESLAERASPLGPAATTNHPAPPDSAVVVATANTITPTNPKPTATDSLCVSLSPPTRSQIQHQHQHQHQPQQQSSRREDEAELSPARPADVQSPAPRNPAATVASAHLHRRSSDSDLSITPKDKSFKKKGRSFRLHKDRGYPSKLSMFSDMSSGNSLTGSDRSMAGYLKPSSAVVRTMNQDALEMLEYPFITMQQYPPGFVLHIGGLVSARSVKLLERITNLEEPEGRDSWWTEIRMEVRSHARALACNVVIGYKEETSICDDVCVLSGSGTAAVINLHSTGQDQDNVLITHVQGPMSASTDSDKILDKPQKDAIPSQQQAPVNSAPSTQANNASRPAKQRHISESNDHEGAYSATSSCSICHLPYNKSSINFQVSVSKCAVCRRAKVPDVLFTTVELAEGIPITGRGCFIQATVSKAKRDSRGELNAKEISDCLPFLEYELHSLLLNKLRMRGMNAVFGLRVQLSIGERFVIGIAVGTAVYLAALPPPSLPQIATGNSWHDEDQLADIQKSLVETVKKNVEFYQLKQVLEAENGRSMSDTDESEDELPELDLGLGMKDVCVLEVDDVEDFDRINLLMDERPPNDFHVANTESIPGLEDLEIVRNLQMFTQVSRAKIPSSQSSSMPSKYFARLLQTVYFKLRRMVPCALCHLQFKISMPEQDEIQLSVIGMALGLGEPTKYSKFRKRLVSHSANKDQLKKNDDNDMIFCLDEDHAENCNSGDSTPNVPNTPNAPNTPNTPNTPDTKSSMLNPSSQKPRPRSPLRMKHTTHRHRHVPLKERYGVDITPLSYLPGGRIERYLGNLNFFFIRESNSIRENGGLSGFTHSFVTEVLAIVRAHVTALGGNAMVAFFLTQCVLLHSPHKNQGQCLINVGGDVVSVSYFGNDNKQQLLQQQQQQQQQPPLSANSSNC